MHFTKHVCKIAERTTALERQKMSDLTIKDDEKSTSVAQDMINVIATAAKDKDVDVSKMERLLEVQIKMMDKQAELEYNQSFFALKKDLPMIIQKGAIKNKAGNITSRYSKYEDLHEHINPILEKYGFTFSHKTKQLDGKMVVSSVLRHIGGHSEVFDFVTPMDSTNALKSPMQAAKSTASFGKRTNFINALDITETTEGSEIYQSQVISQEQAELLEKLVINTKTDREKFMQFCGVDSMLNVKLSKFQEAHRLLLSKVGKSL